tara:strand:+ start:250 stop:774 length:525 start_codon:yes stop_codon:yes gene_type:complete
MKIGTKEIGLIAVGGVVGAILYMYFKPKSKNTNVKKVSANATITNEEIKKLLDDWKTEICNPKHTPESISNLYDDEALLHGTLANDLAEGKRGIQGYFKNLLENDNLCVEINNNVIQNNGSTVSNTGEYTFSLDKKENGKPTKIDARYTFVYGKGSDGKWKILNHHSSKGVAQK